jgi:hypothetical protein
VSIDAIAYVKTLPVSEPTSRLLMWSIAENTYNDTFRCKVGNLVLAEEVGVHERTIMRRLKELEDGGLITRHPNHRSNGRRPDAIEIVGFEAWLMANRPHRMRRVAGGEGPHDSMSGGVSRAAPPNDNGLGDATSPPDNLPTGQFAHRAAGVRLPTGQQVSGGNKEDSRTRDPVLQERTPLAPHACGAEGTDDRSSNQAGAPPPGAEPDASAAGQPGGSASERKRLALIATLRAGGVAAKVLDHLIAPLLSQRRFSCPDPEGGLRQLAAQAADLAPEVLDAVAADVLKAAKAKFAPRHVEEALKERRAAGIAFVIKPHMPEWHRWAEYLAVHEPAARRLMERYQSWQVPSRWPPGKGAAATGEAA